MELLKHGWDTLKSMPKPVAAFIGWFFVITISYRVFTSVLADSLEASNPPLFVVLRLAGLVSLGAIAAVVMSVYFAELGRETDKPLWKCPSPVDAIRRFFFIWFFSNLLLLTVEQFMVNAAASRDERLMAALLPIYIFISICYLPIGACIMFSGRVHWPDLGETLRPLLRELSNVIVVMFILFTSIIIQMTVPYFIALALDPDTPLALPNLLLPTVLVIPVGILECLAFIMMFQICMIHRTTDYDSDDFDF